VTQSDLIFSPPFYAVTTGDTMNVDSYFIIFKYSVNTSFTYIRLHYLTT